MGLRNGSMLRTLSLVLVSLAIAIPWPGSAAALDAACIEDGTGSFTKRICIDSPGDGAVVTDAVRVTGTVSPLSGPRIQKVEYFIDGQYVLTDFRSSSNSAAIFEFDLPTRYWIDGTHRLEMRAITRAEGGIRSYTTQPVGIDLSFDNGITEIGPNPRTFRPSPGRPPGTGEAFTVAAVGDGASGEPDSEAVADLLATRNPNMLLYLGDVYEKGTRTEFYNWYGEEGRSWGRLRSNTNPTVGNHEYEGGQAPGYFDYWDNVPNYYSFDAAGWHFINLNSNATFATSPVQFGWLTADIAQSSALCTIAYWHHPAWTIGTQGNETRMHDEWKALVDAGVDIVLAAHDHNYQRFVRLGPEGRIDDRGVVSFVVGTGGHGIRPFAPGQSEANPMVARASDSLAVGGALFLELARSRADFRFVEADGNVLDQGSVPCRGSHRQALEVIVRDLEAAGQTLTGRARDKTAEAVRELNKALVDDKRWSADGSLSDRDGKGVFEKMKHAVEKLLEVSNRPAVLTGAIDSLVNLARLMAQERIDRAVALGGDPRKIAESREHMSKAVRALEEGKPNRAIDEYKQAWEKAREATN